MYDGAVHGRAPRSAISSPPAGLERRRGTRSPSPRPRADGHSRRPEAELSAFRAAQGVVGVQGRDIPGENDVGPVFHDDRLFAETRSIYPGALSSSRNEPAAPSGRAVGRVSRDDPRPRHHRGGLEAGSSSKRRKGWLAATAPDRAQGAEHRMSGNPVAKMGGREISTRRPGGARH